MQLVHMQIELEFVEKDSEYSLEQKIYKARKMPIKVTFIIQKH